MTREELISLGVSEDAAERVAARMGVKEALRNAGVRSLSLALPLIDEGGDVEEQIRALKADAETALLFEAAPIRGVSPGESADEALGITKEEFEKRKGDPDWINRNWAQIADALEHGRLTN